MRPCTLVGIFWRSPYALFCLAACCAHSHTGMLLLPTHALVGRGAQNVTVPPSEELLVAGSSYLAVVGKPLQSFILFSRMFRAFARTFSCLADAPALRMPRQYHACGNGLKMNADLAYHLRGVRGIPLKRRSAIFMLRCSALLSSACLLHCCTASTLAFTTRG